MTSTRFALVGAFALALPLVACGGPTVVRGEDTPGLDNQALSTSLDNHDLQKMAHENLAVLQNSGVVKRWQTENRPSVAVLPIKNDTTEHIDSALDTLLGDVETQLINWGGVRVVSHENQGALIDEVRQQNSDAFDKSTVARWGQQIGVRYFVTGKVFANDERESDTRRVQYTLFMQVLDAETSEVLFQNKSSVTKALVR